MVSSIQRTTTITKHDSRDLILNEPSSKNGWHLFHMGPVRCYVYKHTMCILLMNATTIIRMASLRICIPVQNTPSQCSHLSWYCKTKLTTNDTDIAIMTIMDWMCTLLYNFCHNTCWLFARITFSNECMYYFPVTSVQSWYFTVAFRSANTL